MDTKKFVNFKKEELGVKEYIKRELGKGKISSVNIEYTPIGEKIVVATSKPGLVIGRKGEKIDYLTNTLKKKFSLDNPHIEIKEIKDPRLDAQLVADDIAILLERRGSLKFKVIAYKALQEIMRAGARGTELILAGKLPSDRARVWRFTQGYLKKTGDPAKLVDKAQSHATTISGVVGIKVSILHPEVVFKDRIVIDEELRKKINTPLEEIPKEPKKIEKKKKPTKKESKK